MAIGSHTEGGNGMTESSREGGRAAEQPQLWSSGSSAETPTGEGIAARILAGRDTHRRVASPHSNITRGNENLPPTDTIADERRRLITAAGEIYRMRRARDRIMPADFVGEPAWDMLLALYSEEPAKLPVSSVCYGSGVPTTTALRWIGALVEQCLVERTRHNRDRRLVLLSLTDEGRQIVERSLKAMLR